MNKLNTSRLLMVVSILLIIAFQGYWLQKLFREEESNFRQSADLVFRETMYRLQAERFKGDTLVFRGLRNDNLFMNDVISSVKKIRGDSTRVSRKFVLSVNTTEPANLDSSHQKTTRDTVMFIDSKSSSGSPDQIRRFLDSSKILNDTIPTKRIDSLYRFLLKKDGVSLPFQISRSTVPETPKSLDSFLTKQVSVGFLTPFYYQASFADPDAYVWKKIQVQLLLSFLLVVLTTLSFVFIYRNLLMQKKLTAIKSDFINNITHELKTPIATVSVAIEALRDFGGLQSREKTKEYLDISALELQRLSMLVDKVLKLSMFENKAIELHKESFNLLWLIEQSVTAMKLQFEKMNATVKVQSSGENFTIEADPLHLSSVVYNLLDNALKYSKEKPVINVHLLDQNDYLELRISDNGIGIPPEYRLKIFDQFFRVPNGDLHNIKGYGLGLGYVHYIVKRHHGFVEAESEPGKGSSFITKLPFREMRVIQYDKNRQITKSGLKIS